MPLNPLRTAFRSFASEGEQISVECPSLGDSITEGAIAEWAKKAGDVVAVDDVVAVIETDKISSELRSPHAGTIDELLFEEGDVIEVGSPLYKMTIGATPSSVPAPKESGASEKKPEEKLESEEKPKLQEKPKETPKPQEKPKKVESVKTPGSRTETRVPMSRMRLRIAERLKESQNVAASLTTFNEIDMTNIIALRSQHKEAFQEKHGVKLGFMSIFVKAAVSALQEFPAVNSIIEGKEIVYRDYVDISVAVATPNGLVVPVLRNCETMSFADVEKNIVQLGKRARDGQLAMEDMVGGTFTISNGGVYGSLFGTPIINMPQSAILGMHGTVDRPVAVNGEVKIRPMMYIALTYDHRIIDGREAVTFLKKIKSAVEDPATLLLEL